VDDPDKAIREFKMAISLRPDYVSPYADMAKAYIHKKDYAASLDFALKSIELNNNMVLGYVYAIHDYIYLDRLKEARDLLKRALIVAPDDENLKFFQNLAELKDEF